MDLWALTDLCTPWCIHVVATLRIADRIDAGVTDVGQLAASSGADRDSLHRVLRHLVNKGVFLEPAPGRFELNDLARGLIEVRLGLDLDGIGGRMAGAWATLLSAVRTGRPAYREAFGREFWDDLEANPGVAASFDALMGIAGHGVPDSNVLADPESWESVRTVVDVGGGTGALLAEVLRNHPGVRGTLVDLPRVVAGSAAVFQAAGVTDRATAVGQSFFDPLPAGADLYILKSVLSDWPDPKAVAILKRCAEASRPSGRVVFFTNAGPGEQASPELLMMVLVGGRDRTLDEFRELTREAGLKVTAVGRQLSGRVIVECRPT
jgi:SAM-dependent methyltransferase